MWMSLSRAEDSAVSRLEEASVADGVWHHLQLEVRTSSRELGTGPTVTLALDYGLYTVGLHRRLMLSPFTVGRRDEYPGLNGGHF